MNEPLYQSATGMVTLEDWLKAHSDERYMHVETACHQLASQFPKHADPNTTVKLNQLMSSQDFHQLLHLLQQLPEDHRPTMKTSADFLLTAVKISNRIIMAVHTD
jgi:hypothetical protein